MTLCNLCDHLIKYVNHGLPVITDNIKTTAHLRKVIVRSMTPRISGASDPDKDNGLYGLSAVYSGQQREPQHNQRSIVHLLDRVDNFEAMLIAFVAQKNLSFSIFGKK